MRGPTPAWQHVQAAARALFTALETVASGSNPIEDLRKARIAVDELVEHIESSEECEIP